MINVKKIAKNLIKVLFLLIILVLSTTFKYNVSALDMNYNILSGSTNPYWYCCQHGAPMPGETLSFSLQDTSYATPRETFILLFGNGYYGYKHGTPDYQLLWWETEAGQGGTHTTTVGNGPDAKENDILYLAKTEMFNNDNRVVNNSSLLSDFANAKVNYNKYVQVAGKIVNFAANNDKYKETSEIGEFVDLKANDENIKKDRFGDNIIGGDKDEKASAATSGEVSAFETYFQLITGQQEPVCGENGFAINYNPKWLTGGEYDTPTVKKRDGKFIVGPFGLDYLYFATPERVYSEISSMKLILETDNGADKVIELGAENINREVISSPVYPDPNQKFDLVFDAISDITKVKDIEVTFRYMNACGEYQLWDGTYTREYEEIEYNEAGDEITATYSTTVDAQTTGTSTDKTRLWYETIVLHRNIDIVSSKVVVKKSLVDSEGNEIDYNSFTNEERVYNFEMTVNGAVSEDMGAIDETSVIAGVRAGENIGVESKVYYWIKSKNSVPTFTLKEVTHPENLQSIEEIHSSGHGTYANGVFSGTLADDKSIELLVKNKIESKKGNIVVKKVDKPVTLNGHTYKINENEEFKIKVKIIPAENGTFRVNEGSGYTYYGKGQASNEYEKELTVKINTEQKLPFDIEWFGDKAPTYEVSEDLGDRTDVKLVGITPKTDELVNVENGTDNAPITVTVENEAVTHKARIHIIKTVVIDDVDDEVRQALVEKVKDEKYAFDINVTGFDTESTGDITSKFDGNKYIWEYTSTEYNWQGNEGPEYTITETKAPEGTKLIKDGQELTDKTTPKTRLVENAENEYLVDNELENHINVKHTSKLSLKKIIDSKDLVGKDFLFEVKLTGLFKYQNKLYNATEENPVWFTNGDFNVVNVTASTDKENKQYIKLRIDSIEEGDNKTAESVVVTTDEIEWYSCSGAPEFEAIENTEGLEDVLKSKEISPHDGPIVKYKEDGKIDEGAVIEIVAKNNGKITKEGRLHVIKTLEGANNYEADKIKDIKFYFEVSYSDDNYEHKEPLTLNAEYKENENKWVWEGYTETKTWKEDEEAPKYRIVEIIPEDLAKDGVEFVSIASACGNPDTNRNGDALEGTLVPFETKESDVDEYLYGNDVEVINKIEKEYTGKIILTKTIEDKDSLKKYNKENGFNFKIEVKSDSEFFYEINGKKEKIEAGKSIYLTNVADNYKGFTENAEYGVNIKVDEKTLVGKFTSGTFSWKDTEKAPYVVNIEEASTGITGMNCTITPKSGTINGEFKATAKNTITAPDEGKIKIIKHLDNTEANLSDEKIKSMVFKYKVSVDGYTSTEVILRPQEPFGARVITFQSDELKYTWTGTAPNATVEELEIDKLATFDHLEVNGSRVEGKIAKIQLSKNNTFEFKYVDKTKNDDTEGKLVIKKNINSDSLKNENFMFDVKVTGSFTYNGKKYSNETCTIENVTVKGGGTTEVGTFTWENETHAPTYVVTEKEHDKAKLVSITNGSGSLKPKATVTVIATNEAKKTGGSLEILKQIADGKDTDKEFTFEIKVGNYEPYRVSIKANKSYTTDRYEWDMSESAPTYTVTEIATEGSTLESINEVGNSSVSGKIENKNGIAGSISGTLKGEDAIVQVVAKNKLEEKTGSFKVHKQVLADTKIVKNAKTIQFHIKATITGDFEYREKGKGDFKKLKDDEHPLVIDIYLKGSETSPEYEFKWSGEAPKVTVEEDLTGSDYRGWKNTGISNNNTYLQKDSTTLIVVSNEYLITNRLDLTVELAGDVWEDAPLDIRMKNDEEKSKPNGRIDKGEDPIKGVEVYIIDASTGKQAKVYSDSMNTELTQPIITNENGHWDAPRVSMAESSDRFEVRFVYDGQTYKPTDKLLAIDVNSDSNQMQGFLNSHSEETKKKYKEEYKTMSDNDKISLFMSESEKNRNIFANTSMARDIDREEVDNRISSVYGYSAITGEGNTVGKVNGQDGEKTVYYGSRESADGIRISKIKTKDDRSGVAYDLFKATASTGDKLVFPFDDSIHLDNVGVNITDYGEERVYYYSATYDYTKHINLGLTKREDTDIEVTKDLIEANVVVKDRLVNYKFGRLSDVGKSVYDRELDLSYELGLYKTDYYYRAEMYQVGMAANEYKALSKFYEDVGGLASTELEVYLQYKITIRNSGSNVYDVKINSIDDYYDSTFKLLEDNVERYVATSDGGTNLNDNGEKIKTLVAKRPYIENGSGLSINKKETGIKGSDGVTYNKLNISLDNVKLSSGEAAYVYLSYQINKGDYEGVRKAIALGGKSNIAELSNYSTFYANGNRVAGKIDLDSAPGNINIREYNTKSYYEDDTYSAPVLNLTFTGNDRTVSGISWEDKAVQSAVGNGLRDNDEALIGGLTTELVEKLNVNNDGKSTDYDFVWPTNTRLDSLGGMTIKELTGFDSSIETSRGSKDEDAGTYKFNATPAGNYAVRFTYGNDKTSLQSKPNTLASAVGYINNEGTELASKNVNVLSSNYDGDVLVKTAAVYNGQDYKSTVYQAGLTAPNSNGYYTDEWFNLQSKDLVDAKNVSDARDSETRRLEVIGNSETITNSNGTVLNSANNKSALHTELYNDYYMYADTAKLNLNIANLRQSAVQGIVNGKDSKDLDKLENISEVETYNVEGIDFGLIERPKNVIILDKEISEIILRTNDGKSIFDAKYDIVYSLLDGPNDGKIKLGEIERGGVTKYLYAESIIREDSIGIEALQALNKEENKLSRDVTTGKQNFKYINVDEEILQGTTIEIAYKLNVLNIGDEDYTSKTLANITSQTEDNKVNTLAEAIENSNKEYMLEKSGFEVGKYLGSYYYTGNKANNDEIVKTKVRQLIDYVDNDGVFEAQYNQEKDHSWRTTTSMELQGNGYEDNKIVDFEVTAINELYDDHGQAYIADSNRNVVLSINDITNTSDTLNNNGLEADLVPAGLDGDNSGDKQFMSQIDITVSKVVAAEDDADNLAYDNIAEIVKLENSVGRRDITAIPGNSNPKMTGEFSEGLEERDSSATEIITFTPPQGIEEQTVLTNQILIAVVMALGIAVAGIVVIKKKVLTK